MEMSFEEIRAWVNDYANEYECNSCPFRIASHGDCLPCGQQHCWVSVQIASGEEVEECEN